MQEKTKVEKILVLAKTYPSPSAKHAETSCVAGINEQGEMRRLFPVPFRLINENSQFQKWEWISVRIEKSRQDHRVESHRLFVDTIKRQAKVDTKNEWAARREWLRKIPTFASFAAMEEARQTQGMSLALLRPTRLIGLDIEAARNTEWTEEERQKLLQLQQQGDLFSTPEINEEIRMLRKVPFDFYYRYSGLHEGEEQEHRHKIVDWEACMLFWNCQKLYGDNWKEKFRAKLEVEFQKKDLMLLMGTIHRFPDQWLIISLIYPPKVVLEQAAQASLF